MNLFFKKNLAHVFSYEFYKVFKKIYFVEHLQIYIINSFGKGQ